MKKLTSYGPKMKKTKCPILLAAWIMHYGNYEPMSKELDTYVNCGEDCEWFCSEPRRCAIKIFDRYEEK